MKTPRMTVGLKMIIVAGAVQAVAGLVMGNAVQGLMGCIVAYLAYQLGDLATTASGMAQTAQSLIEYNKALCLANQAQRDLIQALIEENAAAGRNQP